MLLSEQLRHIKNEEVLIDDSAKYTTSNNTWTQVKDYGNITLDEDTLILVKVTVTSYEAGIGLKYCGGGRIKIGDIPCVGLSLIHI